MKKFTICTFRHFLILLIGCVLAQPGLAQTFTDFNPKQVDVGGVVTITGTTLDVIASVKINTVDALILSKSSTQLEILVMPGTTTGTINLTSPSGNAALNTSLFIRPFSTNKLPQQEVASQKKPSSYESHAKVGFSTSISADGNTIAIGAPGEGGGNGVVWIYSRNQNGFLEKAKLVPTNPIGNSQMGYSVSLSADGSTVATGGPADNGTRGALWIFERVDNTWTTGIKLTGTGWAAGFSGFGLGVAVAVSADGKLVVGGGPNDSFNVGAAWVFKKINIWAQQGNKLIGTPFTSVGGSPGSGPVGQGNSIAISGDGKFIAMGGPGDSGSQGAVWIFNYNSGLNQWAQTQKVTATGANGFGRAVAFTPDASVLAVGSDGEDGNKGAAYIFEKAGNIFNKTARLVPTQIASRMGRSIAISADGKSLYAGESNDVSFSGTIREFIKNNNTWSGERVIEGTSFFSEDEQGKSVALSGDGRSLVIGGPGHNWDPSWINYGDINWTNEEGAFWIFDPLFPSPGESLITINNVTTTSMDISLSPARIGISRVVVAKTGSAPVFVPTDGQVFAAGQDVGNSEKVIYAGSSTSFKYDNLTSNSTYFIKVYEYSGTGTSLSYAAIATNANQTTLAPPAPTPDPSDNPSGMKTNYWMPVAQTEVKVSSSGDFVYVGGGQFSKVGKPLPYGAMINLPDGAPNLNAAIPDSKVDRAFSDAQGGFFVSGTFNHVGGISRRRLAHIQNDGAVSSFNPTLGQDLFAVNVLASTSDAVFVSVGTTVFDPTTQTNKSKFFVYGFDHSGITKWVKETSGFVYNAIIANNSLFVFGQFTTIDGSSKNGLAAVDVATGNVLSWNPGNVFPSTNYLPIAIGASNSELILSYKISTSNFKIAAIDFITGQINSWNATGTLVNDLIVNAGKIFISGKGLKSTDGAGLHTSNGLMILDSQNKIVLPNPTTFSTTGGSGHFATSTGKIFLTGQITNVATSEVYGGVVGFDATSYNINFSAQLVLAPPGGAPIANCVAADNNKIYVGGYFIAIAANRNSLYGFNKITGELAPWNHEFDGEISDLHATSTKLYVSGWFTHVDGQSRAGLASFDLPSGALTNWSPSLTSTNNGNVEASFGINVGGDENTVYLDGSFENVDGNGRRIAAFNASTGNLLPWNPTIANDGTVSALVTDNAGVYVAVQHINTSGSTTQIHLLDKATGQEMKPAIPMDAGVQAMGLTNSTLFIGGDFMSMGGLDRLHLAAIDVTSGTVNNWNPNITEPGFYVSDLSAHGGSVYILGSFHSLNGIPRNSLAALDATSGEVTDWKPNLQPSPYYNYSYIANITSTEDAVFIGGSFAYDIGGGRTITSLGMISPDRSNSVTGKVFYDTNANGVMDAGEKPASEVLLEIQPGNIFYPTESDGNYKAFTGTGNYTIKPVTPPNTVAVTPTSRNLNFSGYLQQSGNNDFALQVIPNVNDMEITMANATAARPGFDLQYMATYHNKGTTQRSGMVSITLDANLQFLNSNPVPSNVNGNILSWNYSALDPGNSGTIHLNLKVPVNINLLGQMLVTHATVSPSNDDVTTSDNNFDLNQVVVGSYDPNDKLVTPLGYGPSGYIPQNTSALTYTVRFQNMGTADAINITIEDQLDASLDVSSFNMISSSHPYTYIIQNGKVTWSFSGINLPYSSVNEPGSHGFVTYTISPKPNLPEGTAIMNSADIYFDFNPAVPTNVVLNTIKNPPYIPVDLLIPNVTGKQGTDVLVPVKVSSFNNILGAQFSITWDPAVATFVGVQNLSLPGMDASASFGTTDVGNGVVSFAWVEPTLTPRNLADNSDLFAVKFNLIGTFGQSTGVIISGQSTSIEIFDKDYHNVPVQTTAGTLTIDPTVTVSGNILYRNNQAIQNIQVDILGSSNQTGATDTQGKYSIVIHPTAGSDNFTIQPSKNIDPNQINGIDVGDVALMQRHILKKQVLTDPLQLIAADVNESKSVSVLDVGLVQAQILGTGTNYPGGTFWTFVPASFVFSGDPFTHPKVSSFTANQLLGNPNVDFIGVKFGDVNGDRDNNQSGRLAGTPVTFDIHQELPADAENIIEVPVRAKNFSQVSGYQFTVNWDKEKLEYLDLTNQKVSATIGNNSIQDGLITMIWSDEQGGSLNLIDKDVLFSLKFRTLGGGFNDVSIDGSMTPARAYNGELKQVGVNVTRSELETEDFAKSLVAYPNPFRESLSIEFYSPKNEEVNLSISDAIGQKISDQNFNVVEGKNRVA